MFIRQNNYEKAIQKVRIEVGTMVGLDKDDEAYLVLKELPTVEIMKLREAYAGGEIATIEFFQNVLPQLIVDHNFYETENKKMSNKDVVALIFERAELSTKVMNDYSSANFFTQKKKTEDK